MSNLSDDPELRKILESKARQLSSMSTGEEGELVVHLDETTFDDFISKNKVVVVDFWAPWCAPCHMLAPVIEELAHEHPEIKFAKVNADQNPGISSRYYVMSLPTILVFKDGEVVDQIIGAVPKEALEAKLKWLQ